MKIYDCFMFFDEDMLLDLRLNIMDKYVDKFVIIEANYMHSGRPKKLNFDINKFPKYKDKIIYKVVDKQPTNIVPLDKNDDEKTREVKLINNSNRNTIGYLYSRIDLSSPKKVSPNMIKILKPMRYIHIHSFPIAAK